MKMCSFDVQTGWPNDPEMKSVQYVVKLASDPFPRSIATQLMKSNVISNVTTS